MQSLLGLESVDACKKKGGERRRGGKWGKEGARKLVVGLFVVVFGLCSSSCSCSLFLQLSCSVKKRAFLCSCPSKWKFRMSKNVPFFVLCISSTRDNNSRRASTPSPPQPTATGVRIIPSFLHPKKPSPSASFNPTSTTRMILTCFARGVGIHRLVSAGSPRRDRTEKLVT